MIGSYSPPAQSGYLPGSALPETEAAVSEAQDDARTYQDETTSTDFDTHLRDLDGLFRQQHAVNRAIEARRAAKAANGTVRAEPLSPEQAKAQQFVAQRMQELGNQQTAMQSAFKAALQNLDPVQRAAFAMKLHQNAAAMAAGRDTSEFLDMPMDQRSALLSATYGQGGTELGSPFNGAARILSSLGPTAQLPRSTLDIYRELQTQRPHTTIVHIHAPKTTGGGRGRE